MIYRGHKIVRDSLGMGYIISPSGTGSVHTSLRGGYTSTKDAEKAIDRRVEQTKEKKPFRYNKSGAKRAAKEKATS